MPFPRKSKQAAERANADPEKQAGRSKSRLGGLFDDLNKDMHAMYGEFVGTVLFLLLGCAAVQATVTNLAIEGTSSGTSLQGSDAARLIGLFYISAGFGFSLFAIASIFYRFTGSIFNPNVSFALLLIGAIKPVRFVLVVIAQFVGAIVASAILDGLTPGKLAVSCALGFGTNRTQGLFIEMFTTTALVLSVLMLAAEKSAFTPLAPLGFGFTLFVCELFAVQYTGGAVNTARAFGPAVISGFNNYHWIYWLGPTLGALLATGFFYLLKMIKYWEITPGQDSTNPEDSPLRDVSSQHGKDERSNSNSTSNDVRSTTPLVDHNGHKDRNNHKDHSNHDNADADEYRTNSDVTNIPHQRGQLPLSSTSNRDNTNSFTTVQHKTNTANTVLAEPMR